MRLIVFVALVTSVAHAAPEPTGARPRMLLDNELRSAWQAQAKAARGPVVGAIALCNDARDTREHDRAVYQGSEWAKVLQACLVAWAATDDKSHAATAVKFFTALIDDLDAVGDGKGGNEAARRDDGYAIRNLGPYTALAYDWLYDRIKPDVRARARERWAAWLAWYREHGYRANTPGTNYHAGYLLAATAIAIAQAGDAKTSLWADVEKLWTKDMAAAFTKGVLAGGDWPEGWQYGPLAVAEYALGARLMKSAGVEVPGTSAWLAALMKHHVYALSPADAVYAGGDTEEQAANIKPNVLTLDAIALGDASPDDKRWARGELNRLGLVDRDWLLYDALAAVGDKPVPPPRETWPTWHLAKNTGTLFARTRWDDQAIWLVFECHAALDVDHRHAKAGNFVLSRGKDDVIVDPSPYGTQSTLTSNAPTVASGQLPPEYIPSQASWSEDTDYDFVTQRASGIVAARCDYSDQYKFQHRKSDVPDAFRDLVMIPTADGRDATVIVIDRANTGSSDRALYLRFRTPGQLALDGTHATATVGSTKLSIASLSQTKPELGRPTLADCFKDGTVRGTCDAARIPITEYKVVVPGPKPTTTHVLHATGGAPPATKSISGDNWAGVELAGDRPATIVWRTSGSGALRYKGRPGMHVILEGNDVAAKHLDGGCAIEATGGSQVAIVSIDTDCNVTVDPESPAASSIGTKAAKTAVRSPRAGCCGAQTAPSSPIVMSLFVLFALRRRR